MKIKVLQVDAPYLDVVVRWLFHEWSSISPFETLAKSREALEFRASGHLLPSTYVAEGEDGSVLGTLSLVACDYPPRSELTPWVADTYVATESRNCGIGSKLVNHAEFVATQAGIKALYLITRNRRTFYERLEWEVIEQVDYQEAPAALMCRKLQLTSSLQ